LDWPPLLYRRLSIHRQRHVLTVQNQWPLRKKMIIYYFI